MRLSFYKPFSILMLIFTLLWLYNSPTLALSETKYYFGLKGVYHYPAGDFDGNDQGFHTIVQENLHFEFTYDLHELTDNYGAGVIFGAYNQFAAGEFSYSQSKHNSVWQGFEMQDEAILDILNLDFKIFQPDTEAEKIKPYGQIGLVISTLSIKDCVLMETILVDEETETEITLSSERGNARYTGRGYNLGFGLMLNITEKLILDSSVIYQKIFYEDLKTLGTREAIPKELLLTSRTYNFGIKYCF